MSTSLANKALTANQRVSEAAIRASEQLHRDDRRIMAAALAEIALEELGRNSGFALRVVGRYDQMVPSRPRRTTRGATRTTRVDLKPIKEIPGREIDLSAPPDPYFLLELYGPEQLPAALDRHTAKDLAPAVAAVKARNKGTAPSGRSKDAIIEYIVRYVAG